MWPIHQPELNITQNKSNGKNTINKKTFSFSKNVRQETNSSGTK